MAIFAGASFASVSDRACGSLVRGPRGAGDRTFSRPVTGRTGPSRRRKIRGDFFYGRSSNDVYADA